MDLFELAKDPENFEWQYSCLLKINFLISHIDCPDYNSSRNYRNIDVESIYEENVYSFIL